MKFSIVAAILSLAATVVAGPAPLFLRDGTCDIKSCVLDLGPSVLGCASAIAQLGADPFSDAGCLIAAAKDVKQFPPSCNGCAEQFGVTEAIGKAASSVESGLESIGGDIAGLF
ncbi:CBP domain-containing protein [Mycena indigotica]|uniref:CBP domain-containing protein n=1 Tax=Mycena indigotica TaxID=2126181 RepID=A0A8H6W3Y8_9AGAR|nr:CBP domain-containing protein [Mycena indigotica]KAF7304067.1 CBP domain-containing protein [Mycena indigotica]